MNELKIFENDRFGKVRVINKNGEPWFVAKDIAEVLGYTKLDAMYRVVEKQDKVNIDPQTVGNTGFPQNGAVLEPNPNVRRMILINESGLYDAIFSSILPQAKQFRRWVTTEVLPTIRKHGAYITPPKMEEIIANPDIIINLAQELKKARQEQEEMRDKIEKDEPKVLFADAVASSHTSILIGELAKLLKQNGIETGQKRLFTWLRENGYLIKRNGNDYNMPTQRAMEMNLFEIKETVVSHADGHTSINRTTKVPGKGQQYFINKFLKTGGNNEPAGSSKQLNS